MLPRPRFVAPLVVLGAWMTPAPARAAADDASAWTQAFVAAPEIWALLTICAILTAALIAHLGYSLSLRRAAPPELRETLKHAREAGNYQEAWEACGHWPAAYLSRVLRPALERIGQGRERVELTLARRRAQESRALTTLTWCLPGIGAALPLIALVIAWARLASLLRSDHAVPDARTLTLAEGDFALAAAAVFVIAATALIFWITLRGRARHMLARAGEEASSFVQDLAYDDLEGLRVGKDFDAGTLLGEDAELRTSGVLRVSRALTTSCPQCNAPINFSRKTCPHCGTAFEWT